MSLEVPEERPLKCPKSPTHPEAPFNVVESAAKRLLLAVGGGPDKPYGLANIHACAGSLLSIATGKAEEELRQALGVQHAKQLEILKNPFRKTVVLLDPDADKVLNQTEKGRNALAVWKELETTCMVLEENVEGQVNDLVKPILQLKEDLFEPNSLKTPGATTLAVMLAMERIKVEHNCVLPHYVHDKFSTPNGPVDAIYASDPKRDMKFKNIELCTMVLVESKPDGNDHRSLCFILPKDDRTPLEDCLVNLAETVRREGGLYMNGTRKFDFRFPKFDATLSLESIVGLLKEYAGVSSIFDEGQCPFTDALPTELTELEEAFVGKFLHFASFKADRKGAEAKAVTAATVCAYRSMSAHAPPEKFYCDRKFAVILANGEDDKFSPEFVLKVEGGCLDLKAE